MRKCTEKTLCSACPMRLSCPRSVRTDKRSRRPMADSASSSLLRRAADILATGWYSCASLGDSLYGKPKKEGRTGRMSIMVRARRPINRLFRLGLLAVRPNAKGVAEYTLIPGNEGVLECV